MRCFSTRSVLLSLCLLGTAAGTAAHEYFVEGFTLVHPWAEPTAPRAATAPVYFTVENVSGSDRLLRAATPLAGTVELRGASDSGPPLDSIALGPGMPAEFTPGRGHLLLRGLRRPLESGRSYQMTLVFEKAGPVQVMVSVGAH